MNPAPWRSSNCILHDLCALCTSVCSVCSLYVLRVLLCVLCTLCARSTPRIVNLITVLSTSIKKNSLRYTYFRQDNRFETHYLCQPAFQPFSPSWPSLSWLSPPSRSSLTWRRMTSLIRIIFVTFVFLFFEAPKPGSGGPSKSGHFYYKNSSFEHIWAPSLVLS